MTIKVYHVLVLRFFYFIAENFRLFLPEGGEIIRRSDEKCFAGTD